MSDAQKKAESAKKKLAQAENNIINLTDAEHEKLEIDSQISNKELELIALKEWKSLSPLKMEKLDVLLDKVKKLSRRASHVVVKYQKDAREVVDSKDLSPKLNEDWLNQHPEYVKSRDIVENIEELQFKCWYHPIKFLQMIALIAAPEEI